MSKQPTQEKIKEFWEWCGFHYQKLTDLEPRYRHEGNLRWVYPTGDVGVLPPLDLNNLFRYAVPKLLNCNLYGNVPNAWKARVSLPPSEDVHVPPLVEGEWDNDPALAIFWSIWEAIKK